MAECNLQLQLQKRLSGRGYGQLDPWYWSIRSLVNSHLYCTQVNTILGIFAPVSCNKRN